MNRAKQDDFSKNLIVRWRASAATPADADKDELEVRRALEEHEADIVRETKEGASDLELFALEFGSILGFSERIAKRELLNEIRKLESRLRKLELHVVATRRKPARAAATKKPAGKRF